MWQLFCVPQTKGELFCEPQTKGGEFGNCSVCHRPRGRAIVLCATDHGWGSSDKNSARIHSLALPSARTTVSLIQLCYSDGQNKKALFVVQGFEIIFKLCTRFLGHVQKPETSAPFIGYHGTFHFRHVSLL